MCSIEFGSYSSFSVRICHYHEKEKQPQSPNSPLPEKSLLPSINYLHKMNDKSY